MDEVVSDFLTFDFLTFDFSTFFDLIISDSVVRENRNFCYLCMFMLKSYRL